jgi:4-diphosphocytidyl-2C-methyl-D-erythritol kinase
MSGFLFMYSELKEDTKGVIIIRKSNDNRQHNNQQKRDKVTNNDLKNTAQKTRSSIMNTTKTCVEIRYSRMVGSPCFTSGTVVLL